MLAFNKENTASQKTFQGILPIFLVQKINFQHYMLDHPSFLWHFKWHSQTRKISNICVIRCCIYNPSFEVIRGGSNIQHSILNFHKGNIASHKRYSKEYWWHLCYHLWLFSAILGPDLYLEDTCDIVCQIFQIFYSTITWWKFSTFMLALLRIFFGWLISIDAGEIANIICYIVLISIPF